jgi:hypothetical protein
MTAELLLAIAKRQRAYRKFARGGASWEAYKDGPAHSARTLGRNAKRKEEKEQARRTNRLHADKSPERAKKMARLIADVACRGRAREAPVLLPPVKRIGSMDRPGEMTSSELEASQVFAAHLGGIGATATAAAVNERRRRRTTRMRAGPVVSLPAAPAGVWKHRIMCDGGGSPNPGPTGCGIAVATGNLPRI